MSTAMVLVAIEQANLTDQRNGLCDVKDIVHHTDRGSQTRFKGSLQHRPFGLIVGDVGRHSECTGNGSLKAVVSIPRSLPLFVVDEEGVKVESPQRIEENRS
jgi:hypothetical protein